MSINNNIPTCDVCGASLDPGATDAPEGGYHTEAEAQKAADAHDWFTDESGQVHFCKACQGDLDRLFNELLRMPRAS